MLKKTPKIFDTFLSELKEIEEKAKKDAPKTFDPLDLGELDHLPPLKKEEKNRWYKEKYRKLKGW